MSLRPKPDKLLFRNVDPPVAAASPAPVPKLSLRPRPEAKVVLPPPAPVTPPPPVKPKEDDDNMDWIDSIADDLFAEAEETKQQQQQQHERRPNESDEDYWLRRTILENPLPMTQVIPPVATTTSLATASKPVPAGQCDHVLKQIFHAIRLCSNPHQQQPTNASFDSVKYFRDLPLYAADFEDQLLYEAGTRQSPVNPNLRIDVPPCSFGDGCVVKTRKDLIPGLEGRDFTMMCSMTPSQLKALYDSGRKPDLPGPCLCCIRYTLSKLVENIACGGITLNPDIVAQMFYNDVDKVGGYHRCYMHIPNPVRWDGTGRPFAQFLPHALRAEFDRVSGKWRLNQNKMRFFAQAEAGTLPGRR